MSFAQVQGEQAAAYTRQLLRVEQVVNDTVADEPIVVLHEPASGVAMAYQRHLDDHTLDFWPAKSREEANPGGVATGSGTGSTWNILGRCVHGPLTGRSGCSPCRSRSTSRSGSPGPPVTRAPGCAPPQKSCTNRPQLLDDLQLETHRGTSGPAGERPEGAVPAASQRADRGGRTTGSAWFSRGATSQPRSLRSAGAWVRRGWGAQQSSASVAVGAALV